MPITSLGGINHYNAMIFNDHSATGADIEGPLAVRGNMNSPSNASGFTVAGALTRAFNIIGSINIDVNQPALLLKGLLSKNPQGHLTIQTPGIPVVSPTSDPNHILTTATPIAPVVVSAGQIEEVFTQALTDITPLIVNAASIYTTKGAKGNGIGIGPAANARGVYISHNDNGFDPVWDLKSINFPLLEANQILIIYSEATTINFSGGAIFYKGNIVNTSMPQNPTMQFLCPRVMWIFPKAEFINIKGYGVIGSVIALNATIDTSGGNINGQVFAKNLSQNNGFEVHNFLADWNRIYQNISKSTSSTTSSSTTSSSTTSSSTTSSSTTSSSTTSSSTTSSSTTSSSTTSSSTTSSSTTSSSTTSSSTTSSSTTSSSTTSSSTTSSSTTSSSTTSSTTTTAYTGATIRGKIKITLGNQLGCCCCCEGCCECCANNEESQGQILCIEDLVAKDIRVDLFKCDDLRNPIETTSTNGTGEYLFTHVGKGCYIIKVVPPCNMRTNDIWQINGKPEGGGIHRVVVDTYQYYALEDVLIQKA
ncbi:MAG: collagen-binding domain-containing protein [Cellulosilyticaceae bacterium]